MGDGVKLQKDKKATTVLNGFIKIIIKSNQEREENFTIVLRKKYLTDNCILRYLTYNECKSVFAETFIRTSKGNDKLMIKENEI